MSVSFQRQMTKIIRDVEVRTNTLIRNVDKHVGKSIRYGSAVTGAPGQPIKTGALLASWRRQNKGKHTVGWISNSKYAHVIEDNHRGATLRSPVGGFHSVKLTRAGFQAIVRHELRLLRGEIKMDTRGRGSQIRDTATGRWASSR